MKNKKVTNPETIRLGLMPPLSGMVELYGQEIIWAAQIACDEINERGGVLGKPLELIIEDDGSMPEQAVPAAERLIDKHHCVAIIGNLLSNSRIAVADHVSLPRKIPYLNFSFYEGSIFNRYFFSFSALPNQQIDKMIPYMADRFGPKMYFAGNNYEWPRGSIDAAKRALLRFGGEVVGEEYFPIGTSDFTELMDRVARSGADVFVPYAAGSDQINLLNQFTDAGLKDRMAVVMGHYDEAMVACLTPEVREGFYSSNTYFLDVETDVNREYLRRLAERDDVTGIWPAGNGVMTNFGEGTYVCVHAFAAAANAAASTDAEALVEALEHVRVHAPQGEVIMDAITHHASVNSYLSRCEANGRFSIVESFGHIAPVIPERYEKEKLLSKVAINTIGNNDNWQVVSILPYPLPDESELSNPLISRLFKIKMDNRICRQLLKVFNENSEIIDDVVRTGGEQVVQLSSGIIGADPQSLLVTPLFNEMECSYVVISSNSNFGMNNEGFDFLDDEHDSGMFHARGDDSELGKILGATDVGIIAIDQSSKITRVNKKTSNMFGYDRDELIGMSVHMLLPPHMREGHKRSIMTFLDEDVVQRPMSDRPEITCYRKDGSFFPAEATVSKIKTGDGWMMVATMTDISERKKSEEQLVWYATHDPLTHLPNRTLINDRLENALNRSKRTGKSVAIMFIDVDEFKLVNDTYGHEVGDKLLRVIADELTSLVRPGDTVGRFGGDEFVVMCDQINDIEVVTSIADRIINRLKEPVHIDNIEFFSTVSIGIAVGFGSKTTPDSLLKNADAAMYSSKSNGKDGWTFFSNDIGQSTKRQLQIANGLRTAISNNELYTVIQPIVDAKTSKVTGGEVLLRWKGQGGDVSPAEFIPVAEMSGSILEIGIWVFEQSCMYLDSMRKYIADINRPHLSINLSARQLVDKDLIDKFLDIVQKYNVCPANITLEITETTLMNDVERTVDMLNTLGAAGFMVAVDDFGTGYSSLSHLKSLPVNSLKVDKSFVDDIDEKEDSHSIALAIISMAHSLGLTVTAEGVETSSQLSVLNKIGCDQIQGYYFYKPLPVDEFTKVYLNEAAVKVNAS
ncbi:MAG: ABC transporter substrate-binding protein [Gammaproteobacteria bacterium]|nr:ABC transporter substrate-binding protein [Gammaproteobacteria bacterium]